MARARFAGVTSPTSEGSPPRYILPASRICPSIMSGWRAKYSLMNTGPSGVSMGARSRHVSHPGVTPRPCFCKKRMSVVTSVPAFALNAVSGRRFAPIRRAFGQIPSDGRILLVHCVAAGNECHDAALAHLVERFGEEVVVNRVGKGRIGAVSGIEDRVVSKWNIAHDSIKVIVRQDCLFKSLGENGRVRVEPLGDARREAVEFHAGSAASGRERLRHESEEMPDTHRRLQNLRTGRKTEALQSLPHPGNHHGRGEMSVGRGSACRSIFVFRENLAQLVRDLLL